MRRLIASGLLSGLLIATLVPSVAAHAGGHRGGCADFGHVNRQIAQDPAAFGFGWASNLGEIVSWFARLDDAAPGVGDIVEFGDHLACG